MLNHQKIETMSPSGITVGYKVLTVKTLRMRHETKQYSLSCSSYKDVRSRVSGIETKGKDTNRLSPTLSSMKYSRGENEGLEEE